MELNLRLKWILLRCVPQVSPLDGEEMHVLREITVGGCKAVASEVEEEGAARVAGRGCKEAWGNMKWNGPKNKGA